MAKITNVSPLGALDVPLLGRIVGKGETVDIKDSDLSFFQSQKEAWKVETATPAQAETAATPTANTTAPATPEEAKK